MKQQPNHMKKTLPITLLGAALLAGNLNAFADEASGSDSKIFINVNVGANIIADSDFLGGNDIAEWSTGFRLDISFGYEVMPNLYVGAETGWTRNELDKIAGSSVGGGTTIDLYQIPILATVVYHIPLQDEHWKPYVGAGIGGVSSLLAIDTPGNDDTGDAFAFAYQLKVGIAYAFDANWQVDVGYKFMGVAEHDWDTDEFGTVQGGALYNHALQASFTYNF
jgi:opacity protein-like surface antigen